MGSSLKQREERKALVLSARMLADEGWGDVTVRNVSSRGMMLRCVNPPGRNTFVEIRLQKARVVGRVVWSNGSACGINTQDTIDLSDLLSQPSASPRKADQERRLQPRTNARTSVQMRILPAEEASRIFARIFDWSAVVLAVVVGAIALTDVTSTAIRQPLATTNAALASSK
jgi:hypothetical protein